MMTDLKKCVDDFTKSFNQTVTYNNVTITSHRYRSWEYCREAFLEYQQNGLPTNAADKAKVVDNLALQLAFYLASWGMYRGSSFLLRFDYKIHEPVVEWLLDGQYRDLFDGTLYETKRQKYLKLLFGDEEFVGIITKLEEYYKACRKVITGTAKNEVSSTLITKILMGVYGCIPAYDRYFVNGLGKYGLQKSFSRSGVDKMLKAIAAHNQDISKATQNLNNQFAKVYTPMKVVDMYFWEKGH